MLTYLLLAFNEAAEQIVGIPATQVMQFKENSQTDAYEAAFRDACFRDEFIFRVRAKTETFNDEARVRHQVVSVKKVDYVADSAYLIQSIAALRAH